MKTSNKLIIAFALALILIPLLGMVVVSRVYYKEGSYLSSVDTVYTNDQFKSPSPTMTATAIAQQFSSVEIKDAKGKYVSIRLVEDKDYGIKVNKDDKDKISFAVDATGTLQITVKAKNNEEYRGWKTTVIVYAPKINQLSVKNAGDMVLEAKLDSLNLQLSEAKNVGFESNTLIKKLLITADKVHSVYINEQAVNSLNLMLKDAGFSTESCSYTNLTLTSLGKGDIEIYGAKEENDKPGNFTIDNLILNTKDTAEVTLERINVLKATGDFSDQTTIKMPAATLNLIYKK